MKYMFVAAVILFITSISSIQYKYENPELGFVVKNDQDEEVLQEFVFSEVDRSMECWFKSNFEYTLMEESKYDSRQLKVVFATTGKSDDAWDEQTFSLGSDESKADTEKHSLTDITSVESVEYQRFDEETDNREPNPDITEDIWKFWMTMKTINLFKFSVGQDVYDYANCSGSGGSAVTKTHENLSCFIFPISGQYELYNVDYAYTDTSATPDTTYTGVLPLTDAQKQSNTLNCKDSTNLIDMSIDLSVSVADYDWLQDYLDEGGYDTPSFTRSLTDGEVRIVETDDGPQIAVTDPTVTEGEDVTGELRFDWEVKEVNDVVHLVLTPEEYPFSMEFSRIGH